MVNLNLFDKIEERLSVPAQDVLQNIRVLFADNSGETLAVYKHIANRLGWQGLYVHNAVEMMNAVNILNVDNKELDAVITGVKYDEGPTGITAARQIRTVMPNVPIIFITSYFTSIIREEVRRVNGEFVKKPFDAEQLFIRVSQLIYWYRLSMSPAYVGERRRKNSINLTNEGRRITDRVLSVPARISEAVEGLKKGV